MTQSLWSPGADAWETTRIGGFARAHRPEAFGDYQALWRWSVSDSADFWQAIWDEFDIKASTEHHQVRSDDEMPNVKWFDGATLNYAEHALRGNGLEPSDVAIVASSQSRAEHSVTLGELRDQVRLAATGLRRLGVGRGDRVAALMPNIDETIVAFMATASIGAIWTSCAPEFGVRAVVDRWSQVEPKVLLTVDGYRYGGRDIPIAQNVQAIQAELPSLQATVVLLYLDGADEIPDSQSWAELVETEGGELSFEPVPFDHPLYVLYSSGTTGLPKAIVHGHGGVLLEHCKQISLQMDLGPGDRFFWFSTTGWMMWNFLISGLLVGSSVVVFDGNPAYPDLDVLWALAADTEATFVGVSAPFIMACRDQGLRPRDAHGLSKLRGVGSTGAPLPPAGYQWITEEVGVLPIANISGGTDVCSAFVGSAPVLPISSGAFSCRQLGWAIDAFDPSGSSVRDEQGELVITEPAPSMPVSIWGDDGSKYRDAYFSRYPGVWCHGDWITIADDGSSAISGRSDATLNRGGVRLGTADYYALVESDPAIAEALIVHLEDVGSSHGHLVLFVTLASDAELNDEVKQRLTSSIKAELSPRHGPDEIVAMPIVPKTLSGKKLEIPVKRILQGAPVDQSASVGSLADPTSLEPYVDYAKSRLQAE